MKRIIPEYEFSEQQLNTVKALAKQSGLLEDTVKILYGRGIDDAEKIERFMHPSEKNFISPFKMQGMEEAVKLIERAKNEEWSVVVYGDYDADGICASTIMYNALKEFGIDAEVYIPERRNGYGLNTSAIDEIFEECFPQLFITVDCGISGAEEVEYIKEQGAEVIVTDHHELPDRLPDCICINPKFNDGYVYDNLCGAGVALKVGVALNGESFFNYLDFAAIATVADSVPLTGENRDIVSVGLKLMNSNPRKCYSYFVNKNDSAITAYTIAYVIAPRINAAGRMGNARSAFELFVERDESKIFDLASNLSSLNLERQKCCEELYSSAKNKLKAKGASDKIIMLWDESWNPGFVGIVAARLADEYSRPSILFVKNGEMLKGSVRSVENINVFDALKACGEYIAEFGGHAQAAGVNIRIEDFDNLERALNEYFTKNYKPQDFEHTVHTNGKITTPYSARLAKEIEMLEPFGVGNRRPLFETEECALDIRQLKPQSPHLSLRCRNMEFMYFYGAKYRYLLSSNVKKSLVFEFNVSRYKGKEYVRGFVKDVVLNGGLPLDCGNEIAVNNVVNLSAEQVSCNVTYMTKPQIREMMSNGANGDTLYIANGAYTLEEYPESENLAKELFVCTSGNLTGTVLISPVQDVDFSCFDKIVFLETPLSGVTFSNLEGANVIICSDLKGNKYLEGVSCLREDLLKIFSELAKRAPDIQGADSAECALKNKLGVPCVQAAFALEVFRQLNLISFDGGKLTVFRGVKSELTNSALYNAVKSVTENL